MGTIMILTVIIYGLIAILGTICIIALCSLIFSKIFCKEFLKTLQDFSKWNTP